MTRSIIPDYLVYNGIPKTPIAGMNGTNSYGYCCEEFEDRKDLNIMFLGCSWVANTPTFTSYVCEMFEQAYPVNIGHWNMGLGSRNSDYMARTLLCSVDVLKPDIVFLLFPGIERKEYYRLDGKIMYYQLDWVTEAKRKGAHWKNLSMVEKSLIKNMNEMVSHYDSLMNLWKNYKLMEMTLNMRSIPWGFSMVPSEELIASIHALMDEGWMDKDHYIGTHYQLIDTISDVDSHPADESCKQFAKQVFGWLNQRYHDQIIQTLGQRVDSVTV